MRELLFHVTDNPNIKVLEPRNKKNPSGEPCICFTKDLMCSYFGDYVYALDYQSLNRDYEIKQRKDPGLMMLHNNNWMKLTTSKVANIDVVEYAVFEPIPVDKYLVNIFKHYDLIRN